MGTDVTPEKDVVKRKPGRPPAPVKREIQVAVVLYAEEDAALRALAGREGLNAADYLRMIIRREARRYGHLPAGTGRYFEENAAVAQRGASAAGAFRYDGSGTSASEAT